MKYTQKNKLRIVDNYIHQHVLSNCSNLVDNHLFKWLTNNQATFYNQYRTPTAYDIKERIKEYKESNEYPQLNSVELYQQTKKDLEEQIQIEGDYQEVLEWYEVSKELFELFKYHKQPVLDTDFGFYWGRTTSGQAISMDTDVQKIIIENIAIYLD